MKELFSASLLILAGTFCIVAQDRSEIKAEMRDLRNDLIKERQNTSKIAGPIVQALTAADVGEPDSFGKTALFLGIAQSGIVLLDPTCDPTDVGPLGPDDHCIAVPDPSISVPSTIFTNIARITIPGKSVGNIIYAIGNHNVSYSMFNPGVTASFGHLTYSPSVTIESEALLDPTLIDPSTGNPFNGSFTTTGIGTYSRSTTLASGASDFQALSYTRANTLGFSRTFFAGLGLPPAVIDNIFKKPVTIKLNVRVSSRWVDSAVMAFSIRFLGN